VLFGDSARPKAGERMPQRLWFAYAQKGVALHFLGQLVDALDHFPVGPLPAKVVFPDFV
jgi:hypothetical protein